MRHGAGRRFARAPCSTLAKRGPGCRSAELMSLSEDSQRRQERGAADLFYAESWALTEMLILSPKYAQSFPRILALAQFGRRCSYARSSSVDRSAEAPADSASRSGRAAGARGGFRCLAGGRAILAGAGTFGGGRVRSRRGAVPCTSRHGRNIRRSGRHCPAQRRSRRSAPGLETSDRSRRHRCPALLPVRDSSR